MEFFYHVYQIICYFLLNEFRNPIITAMKCKRCDFACKKVGKQKNGTQKYKCKSCGIYQQSNYVYKACTREVHEQFSRLNRMGCGTNKMALFLKISINTLQKWIGKAKCLKPDIGMDPGGIYDIDEMQTSVWKKGNKVWVTYGWDVKNQVAVALHVGGRTSEDLRNVTSKIIALCPSKVNTDGYPAYPNLLKETIHVKGKRKANHIERQHVNLRKDVACLIQRTMCYAKTIDMLEARLKWYFWAETNPYFFLEKRRKSIVF